MTPCEHTQRALLDRDFAAHNPADRDLRDHLAACPACAAAARLIGDLDRARQDRPAPPAPPAPTAAALRRLSLRRRARDLGIAASLAAVVFALIAPQLSAPAPAGPAWSDTELSAALAEGIVEGLAAADPAAELPGTELIDPLIADLQPHDPAALPDPLAPDTIDGWSL